MMVKLLLIGIMGISTFNFGYCSIVLNEKMWLNALII